MENQRLSKENKSKVNIGDYLVYYVSCERTLLSHIVKLGEDNIISKPERSSERVTPYEQAVILKPDGTYLLGKDIYLPEQVYPYK